MFYFTAVAELKPEIVDEIIPEVTKQGGQAKLNCTVVNKGGNTVCTCILTSVKERTFIRQQFAQIHLNLLKRIHECIFFNPWKFSIVHSPDDITNKAIQFVVTTCITS